MGVHQQNGHDLARFITMWDLKPLISKANELDQEKKKKKEDLNYVRNNFESSNVISNRASISKNRLLNNVCVRAQRKKKTINFYKAEFLRTAFSSSNIGNCKLPIKILLGYKQKNSLWLKQQRNVLEG